VGSKVVPVRLGEDELKKIDELVKHGVFRSRSEAIRELVRLGVKLAYVSECWRQLRGFSSSKR